MTEPKLRILSSLSWIVVLLASPPFANAQEPVAIDLLANFDAEQQIVAGEWSKTAEGLQVESGKASRCVLSTKVEDEYDVTVEFTRTLGDDSVVLILPLGNISPALELSAWQGECHGLSRVDGVSSRDANNPTSVRPGKLENNTKHVLRATVRRAENKYSLSASLNGKPLLDWSGTAEKLLPNVALNLPQAGAIGLAAQNSAVTFSQVELTPFRIAKPVPAPSSPSPPPASLLSKFNSLAAWETFNGAQLQQADEGERRVIRAVPTAGNGDRGAFIAGEKFSEGTIEVDLKGSSRPGGSFVGVVFHGVDGETYDSVYFRPFNFGSNDEQRRGHAVQYMSYPDFPWDRLRAERPEEFESRANPEPASDAWFRARIEVGTERIQVFVNDAAEPCLDVEKLGDTDVGKVGLWFNGVASFSNFRFTNAE